jgi:MoaA/NifB/PqqE/SkfB family radical SAM enzyme
MCSTWQSQSDKSQEISPRDIDRLPNAHFVNITGGEPFLRDDLDEIITVLKPKVKRMVVSTNGLLTKRIVHLMEKHPDIGIRISLDGFLESHDKVRGIPGAFNKALRTLTELQMLGIKDLGVGTTVSDTNYEDLRYVFTFAEAIGLEFPINIVHNSYYFHKMDNRIQHKEEIKEEMRWAIRNYLRSRKVKNWFRAYFTDGIIDYINGRSRRLPCEAGENLFVLEPYGDIYPCNVLDIRMGNIKEKSFDEIWHSQEAVVVRNEVAKCNKNCWMIGSVTALMHKKIWKPIWWILKNKFFARTSPGSHCK